jgi:hypothetical protein
VLLQSHAFDSPKQIGQLIAAWRTTAQLSQEDLQQIDAAADHAAVLGALQRLIAAQGE